MIAITFALPTESSGLRKRLQQRRRTVSGGVETLRGEIHGKAVTIFHTGVGAKVCERRIADFLPGHLPARLISAGFAGALTDELSVGNLFVAENFSSGEMLAATRSTLALRRPVFGCLHTAALMIGDATERAELAATTRATAVDMETQLIAEACVARGISHLSLRVISDTPRDSFPVPANLLFDLERQKTNFPVLALHLAKHPASIVRMFRFTRRIAHARQALTEALDDLLRSDLFYPEALR